MLNLALNAKRGQYATGIASPKKPGSNSQDILSGRRQAPAQHGNGPFEILHAAFLCFSDQQTRSEK